MLKWSEMKRESDLILAVWPTFRPLARRWLMRELISRGELSPAWRDRFVEGPGDSVCADHYPNRPTAADAACSMNVELRKALAAEQMPADTRRSLELKIDKALQSAQRLQEEESLMLAEAVRRHASAERPQVAFLEIAPEAEPYRQDLADQLSTMPYLYVAQVGWDAGLWKQHLLLYRDASGSWSKPYRAGPKAAEVAERAKIANGFGLSASGHWGKTKAHIRKVLLPRTNQLLQLASVQRLLSEALARGQRVLVSNGIVFWYEDTGEVGWKVKETATTKDSEGATIWREGTIRSTNHGRLVVLPYAKEHGAFVRGHTKNGPHDGRALPRHPDHYVDLPFSIYDGDLMIGLFGELPYK